MKKRFILFTFLLMLFTNSIVAATTAICLFTDPKPPGPKPLSLIKPLSLTYIPISASISDTDLSVYFDWSVGNATITIYDSYNQVVDQEVVNTNITTEIYIPINLCDSETYTLTITYGTTTLRGLF